MIRLTSMISSLISKKHETVVGQFIKKPAKELFEGYTTRKIEEDSNIQLVTDFHDMYLLTREDTKKEFKNDNR